MIVIMIEGSKNVIVKAAFELLSSHVCEKRSKDCHVRSPRLVEHETYVFSKV